MGGLFGGAEDTEGILHGELQWLVHLLEWAAVVIDLFSVAILLIGAGRFMLACGWAEIVRWNDDIARVKTINRERVELGRYILAALELLIVSDIIHTALTLELNDLVFLGLLVVIRSLISFFLERELRDLKKELGE